METVPNRSTATNSWIGIVVACFLALCLGLCLFRIYKRKHKEKVNENPQNPSQGQTPNQNTTEDTLNSMYATVNFTSARSTEIRNNEPETIYSQVTKAPKTEK
ncbi:hypothetical protein PAMP_005252 [Pampus punctatissimus]